MASKNGKKFQHDLREGYEDATDRVGEFVGSLKDSIGSQAKEVWKEYSEKAKEQLGEFADLESKEFKQGLLMGGVVGVALSVGAAFVYKASCEERNFGQELIKWKNVAKHVMDKVEHAPACKRSNTVDDVLDLAATGLRLWKTMKAA